MSSSLVFLPQSHAAGSRPRNAEEIIHASDVCPAPIGESAATESHAHAGGVSVLGSRVHAGEPRPRQGAHGPCAGEQAAERREQSTSRRFAYSCLGGRHRGEPPPLERATVVVELRQRRANGRRRPSGREYHAHG